MSPNRNPHAAARKAPLSTSLARALAGLAIAALALTASACAAGALQRARTAERTEDYDRAIIEYSERLREHPEDVDARTGLERVRLRASQQHFATGRRLAGGGRLEEALPELQLAAELNPESDDVLETLESVRQQLRSQVALATAGQTPLEALIARTRDLPPPGYELPRDLVLPDSLVLRGSSRDVFAALARFANLSIVFDAAYPDVPVDLDLRQATVPDALTALTAATQSFYQVTAPRTVTIIPDTPAKRREYEREIVRTFFLSNVDLQEAIDLLRIVVDVRRIAPVTATNAITIQDTPERMAAVAKILEAIDKARPEVVIDVELLEVDQQLLREYGLQLASPGSAGISGIVDINRSDLTLDSIRDVTQSDIFLSAVPGLYYRLLKRDANTRILANPQLRASEGIPAQARFGERVPIPVTTFQPIATGGVAQQPITSFNYENIGVNIDITPRLHHDAQITLAVQIEVSSISGSGFGQLPTFANRVINTTIRLKDGETNMLAGLIRDDERKTLEGVPGLSDIPVVGRLFAYNRTETQQTDILLTLTPHIVRVLDLTEEDLRPFAIDTGTTAAALLDLPLPLQTPRTPATVDPRLIPQTPGRPVLPIAPPELPLGTPPVDESEQP